MNAAEALGLPADFIVSHAPQGSAEWHEIRRGVITGSRAKDATDFGKTGKPSSKRDLYAFDLARQRESGRVRDKFQTADMREGQVEEKAARVAYELQTGCLIEDVGFVCTPDRKFGCSPDGLRFENGQRGAIEIKTMLSSKTLFDAFVRNDIGEYVDQILMEQWLLHLDWVDLVLWAPDLPAGRQMRVVRLGRDEAAIEFLVAKLVDFDCAVEFCRAELRRWLDTDAPADTVVPVGAPAPAPAAVSPSNLPKDLFA